MPSAQHLDSNGPGDGLDDAAIIVPAAKRLPHVQTHVNGKVTAHVLVGNNGFLSNTLVLHGDDLATELVVLRSAPLVEDVAWHSDERHVAVHVLVVGAQAAGTVLPEEIAASGV